MKILKFLGLLDIYNTVKELRHRRVNMVANLEQYIFLHDSLLEAVLCGETGVTSNELSRHYDQLITGKWYIIYHTVMWPRDPRDLLNNIF